MINIEVDSKYVEEQLKMAIEKRLNELDSQKIFWDMKELAKKTSMSISHLEKHVIYQPGFPMYRVGKKRVFPAKETEKFLLNWIKDQ